MCRVGITVWVSLVIALVGLPAGVQAQGGDGCRGMAFRWGSWGVLGGD